MPADPDPVVRYERILGGRPVFRNFPTLDRADLQAALAQACEAFNRNAPDVTEPKVAVDARVPG